MQQLRKCKLWSMDSTSSYHGVRPDRNYRFTDDAGGRCILELQGTTEIGVSNTALIVSRFSRPTTAGNSERQEKTTESGTFSVNVHQPPANSIGGVWYV